MTESRLGNNSDVASLGDDNLGWVGVDRNDPDVVGLKDYFAANVICLCRVLYAIS
ncbi:MAG: hypothetical protein ACI9SB_002334 [Candidatus Azotimanducaceae bacterium]